MQDREPAGAGWEPPVQPDDPDAARARMAAILRDGGRALSPEMQRAFASVPRHLFVPEIEPSAAYRDEAFVIKCGPDGLPVSSSSQPAMMAIMLDQLGLQPGHRVLEIGTGTGYNAAVMSAIVGSAGEVISIDIDPELAARARSGLDAAGYDRVTVRCADGGFGDPDGAPFDRIIVTAGAWDIAPAWLSQLTDAGRLVLPLSVRGIQLSVSLERRTRSWVSTSACRCGFVRMLGAFAGPEQVQRLGTVPGLYVQVADGSPADLDALQLALTGPVADVRPPLRVWNLADLADADLWLTIRHPQLDRMTVLAVPGGWLPHGPLPPLGGLVANASVADKLGIAVLLPTETASDWNAATPDGVLVRGYGPGGADLASMLARSLADWADQGRPGAHDLSLAVWPHPAATRPAAHSPAAEAGALVTDAGSPLPDRDDMITLARPSATIEVGWQRA
ncbi:MAG: methyltransferase domain-containing protein [Streptosporangiaceae bacterium]